MLKLKLQYFGHLMQRADSLEKTLMLGQIEGRRRRRWQRMMVGWHHWLDGHESEQAPEVGDGQGSLACYSPWRHKESDTTEQLNWTDLHPKLLYKNNNYHTLSNNCSTLCTRFFYHWLWSLVWEDHWNKKWQPTPVLSPGKFHGQSSLVGYSSWGPKDLDMTEWLSMHTVTLEVHREWMAQPFACMTLNLGWSHHSPYLSNFL